LVTQRCPGSPSAHPAQQGAPFPQHKALAISQEGNTAEIGGLLGPNRVALPGLAAIGAGEQRAATPTGPNGAIGIPGHVQIAIAVGDRHHRLAPFLGRGGIGVEAQLGAPGQHPEVAVGLEAHGLQPLAAHALVGRPHPIAGVPGSKKVAQAAHAHVLALRPAAQIAHGTGGVFHFRLPGVAGVVGAVHGPHIRGQLRLAASQGGDQVGLAGQLGVEEQAAPALAGVTAVQEQPWLAHDPALIALEIDADQPEVFLRWQLQGPLLPGGTAVVGFQDQAVAAHQEAVLPIGEGQIQRVGFGVNVHRLPGAGAGAGQAGADAAREHQGEHQGAEGGDQAV